MTRGDRVQAGVIFDLDGVLIDSEGFWYRASSAILAEFGVSVTRDEYAREWIASGEGPERAVVRYGLPISSEEFRRRRKPLIHRMVVEEAALMPGARAALERLFPHHPLAVATNSSIAWVGPLFDRLALRPYFRDLLTRERYEKAKPEPDAFVAAAAALGLPPAQCVVIEDAERGVVAAHRAGTPCIAVPNEFTKGLDFSLADRVVASLDEVTCELVLELAGVA